MSICIVQVFWEKVDQSGILGVGIQKYASLTIMFKVNIDYKVYFASRNTYFSFVHWIARTLPTRKVVLLKCLIFSPERYLPAVFYGTTENKQKGSVPNTRPIAWGQNSKISSVPCVKNKIVELKMNSNNLHLIQVSENLSRWKSGLIGVCGFFSLVLVCHC